MQRITKRKELVRAFLNAEKDEECEEVGDVKEKDNEQDQHFSRDEDLKNEGHADLKDETSCSCESTDSGNGESAASKRRTKSGDASAEKINDTLLSKTFVHLLRHFCDMFSNLKDEEQIRKGFLAMNITGPYMYRIAEFNTDLSDSHCKTILYIKLKKYHEKPNKIPDMDTLILFKLALYIYPTHLPHPVTTSCLIFMKDIITACRFENARSIARGLFVCTLASEYALLTKRTCVPAALNFLRGILFLSAKSNNLNPIEPIAPFHRNKDSKILILEDDCSKLDFGMQTSALDLLKDSIDNGFKIRTLLITVLLLDRFLINCIAMGATESIFKDHVKLLSRLELELYPGRVVRSVKRFVKCMKKHKKLRSKCEPDVQNM